jgi:hypothetical protein
MFRCAECRNEQTASGYCQECFSTALVYCPDEREVPEKGTPVFYRAGDLTLKFLSLGETNEVGFLSVATQQSPDAVFAYLHDWSVK